jgi:hypothetical protein
MPSPRSLLAISLSGAMGAGAENTLLALTIVFIPPICRVSESVTTQVRGFDFVEAARASGAGTFTIVRVHVLGNVLGTDPGLCHLADQRAPSSSPPASPSSASASSRPSRNGA